MHGNPVITAIIFQSLCAGLVAAAILLFFRPALWRVLASISCGIAIGLADLTASDVQGIALLLLAGGLFLGFPSPRRPWLTGILVGIFVPAFHLIEAIAGAPAPAERPLGSLMAIAFSLAGSYGGSLLRAHRRGGSPEGTKQESRE